MHPRQYLRRKDASTYLREQWGVPRAPRTLAKLASIGGGPEMVYAGRIPLYSPESLDEYAIAQFSRPVRSTSEARNRADKETRPEAFHASAASGRE
jgi:hypothetical protein